MESGKHRLGMSVELGSGQWSSAETAMNSTTVRRGDIYVSTIRNEVDETRWGREWRDGTRQMTTTMGFFGVLDKK